jgi:hypothetical protein
MRKNINDPRRAFLLDALSIGLFASTNIVGVLQAGHAMGDIPAKLPQGRSIFRLEGTVTVDGKIADINTKIGPNSLVRTGPDSLIIFVVETDAFILRANSELKMGSSGLFIEGMRLLTGKILSVFGEREKTRSITTSTATIGVRGTGIYIESDAELSYVCTCYGHTRISANADPNIIEDVVTKHHDRPLYILPATGDGNLIVQAPVINHTDIELSLIEELVGRKPPFAIIKGGKSDDGSGLY